MPADSLVLQLQADALDPATSTPDLIRKALVVARKLDLPELRTWCEAELNGYGPGSEVPPYRKMEGQLMAKNPFHGWVPVVFEDPDEAQLLSKRDLGAPIGDIDSLFRGGRKGGSTLQMPLPPNILAQAFGDNEAYKMGLIPTLIIPRNSVEGVLEAVRNTVLNWALELERDGIMGHGMSFSQDEQEKAAGITYHIGNFQGVLGNIEGGTVQIGDLNTLSQQLRDKGISSLDRAEIEGVLRELERAPEEDKPALIERGKQWLSRNGEAIGALAGIIRSILTGSA